MCRAARPPRRPGFTLVEILVVIAILAVLVALSASGISRVRTAQLSRNTEGTVTKLQQALDAQWRAVVDQCKQDRLGKTQNSAVFAPGSELMQYCSGDPERVEALWVYLCLKREFPQTFAEAAGDPCPNTAQRATDPRRGLWLWAPVSSSSPNATPAVFVPSSMPRQTFVSVVGASVAGLSTPGGGTPGAADAEAAVLLYMILAEKGNKGLTFAADDVTTGAQSTLGTYRVFIDGWGTPVSFARFLTNSELQAAPYLNASTPDPIDPRRKLLNWPAASGVFVTPQQGALNGLNTGGVTPQVVFGQNKLATVASAGQDLAFNGPDGDDLLGYRYRRQGNK